MMWFMCASPNQFIVLEGLDGAGTTTQRDAVASILREKGIPCLSTCEPTDGPVGKLVRSILRKEAEVQPWTLAMLYSADRYEHVKEIGSALKEGKWVISDRYFYSSLAYQGVTCPWEKVEEINREYPHPDILLYIDTPVEECMRRIDFRGQKKELFEKQEYLTQVRANYEKAFNDIPPSTRLYRIDGRLHKEEITEEIRDILSI